MWYGVNLLKNVTDDLKIWNCFVNRQKERKHEHAWVQLEAGPNTNRHTPTTQPMHTLPVRLQLTYSGHISGFWQVITNDKTTRQKLKMSFVLTFSYKFPMKFKSREVLNTVFHLVAGRGTFHESQRVRKDVGYLDLTWIKLENIASSLSNSAWVM